jgi:cyclophilin family peptidyl-prolyl cis-trans isomerase
VRRGRRRLLAALVAVAGLAVAACGGGSTGGSTGADAGATITNADGRTCSAREPAEPATRPRFNAPPPMTIDRTATYRATLATSCGTIVIRLDPEEAPLTVNNFVFLSRRRFYDGLRFHRVVRGFIVQTGDPEGNGRGGPGYTFADELPSDGYRPGAVAMANAGPDTNGSQFFIVTGDASGLPDAYSTFGQVTRGLDVARAIEGFADPRANPADPATQVPTEPIWLYSVRISGG